MIKVRVRGTRFVAQQPQYFFLSILFIKILILSDLRAVFVGENLTLIVSNKNKMLSPNVSYFFNFKLLLVLIMKGPDAFGLHGVTREI